MPHSAASERANGGAHHASPVAEPAMTSSSAAASATVRAIGPLIEKNCCESGAAETRPRCGLIPTAPHHDDGLRMDPPPSEPCEIAHIPAASAAAAPPDEPPHERAGSHGLRPGG